MEKIVLGRIGEIALKGLNRSTFEHRLATNMRKAISDLGPAQIHWSQSRYFVEPESDDFDIEKAVERLSGVFGLVSVSPAYVTDTDAEKFFDLAVRVARERVEAGAKTFKVETKRGMKSFPMNSPQISDEAGGRILDAFPQLKVDVKHPDFTVYIEVRERSYVYTEIVDAPGGMPIGSNGKACLLLSGGIDSPVAGYMIGKRGVAICATHFYSYPYTSERAKEKVIELAKIVSRFTGPMKLIVVPFTDVQLAIMQNCREDLSTILLRRSMMRISERIARKNGCSALITGESVGQVASQTVQAIYCTDNAVANMPIYRPLIGMDKMETVDIARKIGTFDTSIEPYEDCCTVFTPKHPKTRPNLNEVLEEEKRYDYETLEEAAIDSVEIINI
jgi:thiamine biosynthesis protein ThiI